MIDLNALERACEGDPEAKIAVKRKWLKAVHRELTEARKAKVRSKLDDAVAGLWKMGGRY